MEPEGQAIEQRIVLPHRVTKYEAIISLMRSMQSVQLESSRVCSKRKILISRWPVKGQKDLRLWCRSSRSEREPEEGDGPGAYKKCEAKTIRYELLAVLAMPRIPPRSRWYFIFHRNAANPGETTQIFLRNCELMWSKTYTGIQMLSVSNMEAIGSRFKSTTCGNHVNPYDFPWEFWDTYCTYYFTDFRLVSKTSASTKWRDNILYR